MNVFRAGPEHAEVLGALHALSFPAPWQEAEFAALLQQPGVAAWIVIGGIVNEESPEGFILMRAAADEAEVLTLAVVPELRRKGLASKLLRQAFETLKAGKTTRLFLEVAADNAAACALYARHGFAPCGRRPDYYRSDPAKAPVDAIMMSRSL